MDALREILREYIEDGGSQEVYEKAKFKISDLQKQIKQFQSTLDEAKRKLETHLKEAK